jgi:hypothetical protein
MKERPNERLARHIVATALGVPVRRFEDGKANGQVDAVFSQPDGVAALEVIADHEDAFNAQWDALEKVRHRVFVPGLRDAWSAQLARTARVKDVVRRLPSLMVALQDAASEPMADVRSIQEDIERLGIRMLYPLKGDSSGYVNLHAEGWSGFASEQRLAQFVEDVLRQAPEVPLKLAAHPALQRHAFIWTTIGSDYGIQFQLEQRRQPITSESPQLPAGVTHVWVAGSFTSQGVLAWFPDKGWWRPDWQWPSAKPLVLDVE